MEIALASGFSDAKYLSAIIKKRLGCSLTEYRKEAGKGEPAEDAEATGSLLEYKYTDKEGIERLRRVR